MNQQIEHEGIIHRIENNHIQVQITQQSACSSCHSKGACSAADMTDKYIDIESNDPDLKVGDSVVIYGQNSMGLFAVLLAFVLPFILILLTLFISGFYTDNDALSGTIALAMLVPYFFILSKFNKQLKSKLRFYIRK